MLTIPQTVYDGDVIKFYLHESIFQNHRKTHTNKVYTKLIFEHIPWCWILFQAYNLVTPNSNIATGVIFLTIHKCTAISSCFKMRDVIIFINLLFLMCVFNLIYYI